MDNLSIDTASHVLVRHAQESDRHAIDLLYQRYRDRLRLALRKKLGPAYRRTLLDSEDAVQDGILAALSELSNFEYRGSGSFLAWLLRLSERKILMKIRDASRLKRGAGGTSSLQSVDEPPAKDQAPSYRMELSEAEANLQRCLEQLPPKEREVIVLRRYLELDNEGIQEELNLPSPGAVRALLSRAQARLALLLDEAGDA